MQCIEAEPNLDLEAEALRREIQWLLSTECKRVFARIRQLLLGVSISLHEASSGRSAPLHCKSREPATSSEDEPLLLTAVVGSTALTALRIHLTLPRWNQDMPYSALLGRMSVPLPALVTMQNRVAQAIASLGVGHATLPTARTSLQQVLALISSAMNAVTLVPPPTDMAVTPPAALSTTGQPPSLSSPPGSLGTSSVATALREQLQPPPPADLVIDVSPAGRPPRLYVSATVVRASDGAVVMGRVVSAGLDAVEERLQLLENAAGEAASLLAKVEVLSECTAS
jgi:hypothetical protein